MAQLSSQMERMIRRLWNLPGLADRGRTMTLGLEDLTEVCCDGRHLPPVVADGEESEHTGGDAHVGDKVVNTTVHRPKQPDSASR